MLFLELALLLDMTEDGINSIFTDSVILTHIVTTSVFDYNSNIIIMIYFFSIVFVSYMKHSKHANMLLVALISTACAVFSTKSSAPVLISTIYQHCELHLHTLEMPHYVRRCPQVQNYMSRNECHHYPR